ncbi:alpha/beta hydrolase-fold protein [Flammeovirgaceae bacterium SG7u.111]|nr:alpha/beta hydrolase-fold protein [Flammeovirgaceae bacterium SG7u.132]WPO37159.1 alpha/beta hydrolase-fold protein [Flammeovirgaceae bacterium SG7u.111]
MKKLQLLVLILGGILCLWGCQTPQKESKLTFTVTLADSLAEEVQTGRLILVLSKDGEKEPRFSLSDGPATQLGFGKDVEGFGKGATVTFDAKDFGYPIESLDDIPAGKYYVQAVLNRYKEFNLSTGHTVQLPPDKGEGQKWNRKPGNYYSKPIEIEIGEAGGAFEVTLDQEIAPIAPPADSKYIKHIRMKSEKLSEFWGEDTYLGAHVLLPEGFDEHPEAKYPLMVFHGHFPADFGGFRTTVPDPDLEPTFSARFNVNGYNKIVQEEEYSFYQQWISKEFPRMIIIEIQHPTPYYDDSYAVNSASQGPYGDAITYELIPYIEEQFRGIGEGWARFLYGGSTGGWEALAAQVFYPEEYNGCFAACPDPIDFRAYTVTNLYEDDNAYYYKSEFKEPLRPGHRDYLGDISASIKDANMLELVLGTKSRSGQQWDIWEATYSPQGEDGYPQRIWDKKTGEIDKDVAEYWKENYDIGYILQRDWTTLGPKLEGKIHIYCGDMDNYYLNNAVYLVEEILESTREPYYAGVVDYGDRAEHCWNGDHENPNHISRLRYNTMYVPKILDRIKKSAPAGADLTSWRY